ncbi:MAG: MmgE/PrpD family protein [Pseudomonadota bacterium]
MTPSPDDPLAAFVLGRLAIPESARQMAATLIIDTLAVAAGAAPMAAGRLAAAHAGMFFAPSAPAAAAPILFDGRTASIPGAAFAAATSIDNLDAHDGLNATKGHIGCAVVPALFAFAASQPGLTARAALDATVIAYEIAARAGLTLHDTVTDYHTSGAWNGLGVVALGAHLRGLSADALRHALGIAEYHGPRSQMMREIANPTMLHDGSGMGALAGTMAVLLAERGFTGAPAVTTGSDGHWADLGQRWTIEENYIKPYPICRWAHAALDALSALQRIHGFTAPDVARIEINTFAQAARLFPGMPRTTSEAQYSLRFAVATLLLKGQLGPAEISGDALSDPATAALLSRIDVHETAHYSALFPTERRSDVTVELADGRRLASGDTHARGGPEAPLSLAENEAKLHTIAGVLPAARRHALWAWRARLLAPGARLADLAALVTPAVDTDITEPAEAPVA